MTLIEAIAEGTLGDRLTRVSWGEPRIEIHVVQDLNAPLCIDFGGGVLCDWTPKLDDFRADDWEIIPQGDL